VNPLDADYGESKKSINNLFDEVEDDGISLGEYKIIGVDQEDVERIRGKLEKLTWIDEDRSLGT